MNRIEQAAMVRVPDTRTTGAVKPLQGTNDVSAPILTPVIFVVTAGLLVGAAVGYYDAARHGVAAITESPAAFRETVVGASASDLLGHRRDAVVR